MGSNGEAAIVDPQRGVEQYLAEAGHAAQTVNLTLSDLENSIGELDASRPTYVICQGGYRSSVAASILERKGFREIYNVSGGTGAWVKEGLETEK